MRKYTGEKIYYYSFRHGVFRIREYDIIERKGDDGSYKCATTRNGMHITMFSDTDKKFGKLIHHGPGVWMKERDDDYVKKLFIEYEERRINGLRTEIDERLKYIENLRKGA